MLYWFGEPAMLHRNVITFQEYNIMQQPDVFRLNRADDALTKLIHVGEAEILRLLWQRGPLKVGSIHRTIAARRPIAYTSIATQCYKLIRKGLIRREDDGSNKGDLLVPTMTECELVAERFSRMLASIERDYPDVLQQCASAYASHTTV